MREIEAANVCTCKEAQYIRDNILFSGLMANIQPKLLKELRRPAKTEIHLYGESCRDNLKLLEDIQNS